MHRMRSKTEPTPIEGRRKGYGRPIYFELTLERDAFLEGVLTRRGMGRGTYARMAVLEKLEVEAGSVPNGRRLGDKRRKAS